MRRDHSNLKPDISHIRQRAELLRDLRQFFDGRGFLEIQPPCLSRDCVVDPYIDPLSIDRSQLATSIENDATETLFLQTSPELAMKRMLAAGAPSIYSIVPVFRAGESGPMHNVEFTMLEWYDVGASLAKEVELLGELASEILQLDGYDITTYRQVFQDQLGIDPIESDTSDLVSLVKSVDSELANQINDRDDLLDVLMSDKIQPSIGLNRPVVVTHYPLSQAALAKASNEDPACAMRFELFFSGVELANGYEELLDADELLRRTDLANEKRALASLKPLQVPVTLVRAMRDGMPACSGVALGLDRLLMLRCGATHISQVIPFPIQIA